MAFGALPPHLQPVEGQAASPGGNLVRAFGNARRRVQGREAYAAQRAGYVAAASQRLRAIGSPEAEQIATILESNPEGVHAFVSQYGGWTALEDGLRSSASAGAAKRLAGSLPEDSPERAFVEYQAGQRAPDFAPAMRVGAAAREADRDRGERRYLQDDEQDFRERLVGRQMGHDADLAERERDFKWRYGGRSLDRGDEAAERDRDWKSRENALDRESREGIASTRAQAAAARGGALTKSQERTNAKTDHARRTLTKLRDIHRWSPDEMRRIAAKSKQLGWSQIMLGFESEGEGMSDEDYAASLWAIARDVKYGEAPESHQEFMNLAESDLVPPTEEQKAARRRQEAEQEAFDFLSGN